MEKSLCRVVLFCVVVATVISSAPAQTASDYEALVQKGNAQLQGSHSDLALSSGEQAIKMNADRWEGYALAGGALMNLKRYEEAVDKLSEAIKHAPQAKQAGLRELRRQCLLVESGGSPAPKETAPATTTQAEIVLWKSIENSSKPEDFQTYLKQYPQGTFVALAQRHLSDAKIQAEQDRVLHGADLVGTVWVGHVTGGLVFVSFSSQGDYHARFPTPDEGKEMMVNALSLSNEQFVQKYFSGGRAPDWRDSTGTWSSLGSEISLLRERDPNCAGAQTRFLGTRTGDQMGGTWSNPGSSGFFGCSKSDGKWDLHRIVTGTAKTWVDSSSGLMWSKLVSGEVTWVQALQYCGSLSDYSDWRLPTIDELSNPAIKTNIFNYPDVAWSSTESKAGRAMWALNMYSSARFSDRMTLKASHGAICVRQTISTAKTNSP